MRCGAPFAADHEAASIRGYGSTWNVLCTYLFINELLAANPVQFGGRPTLKKPLSKEAPPDRGSKVLGFSARRSAVMPRRYRATASLCRRSGVERVDRMFLQFQPISARSACIAPWIQRPATRYPCIVRCLRPSAGIARSTYSGAADQRPTHMSSGTSLRRAGGGFVEFSLNLLHRHPCGEGDPDSRLAVGSGVCCTD